MGNDFMSAAGSNSCPKCGYARKASDAAPAWQCPSCGIAYSKFRTDLAAAQQATAPLDLRERAGTQGQGHTVASGVVYLILLGIGIFVPHTKIWLLVLPLLALSAFVFWFNAYRRKRAVQDAPTSKIATAAQGYVELCGTVAPAPGSVLMGPVTRKPCIWYAYGIDERQGKDWRTIERGTEGIPFIIRDGTGECLVNPRDAEVMCELCEKWESANQKRREWSIRIGDPIYAIGRFSTRATAATGDVEQDAHRLLQTWVADASGFRTRFDGNRDGKISAAELAAAREIARREVAERGLPQGGLHTLRAPEDGRPFILMNMPHDEAASRFRQWTLVHLCIFFIALGFLAYNL